MSTYVVGDLQGCIEPLYKLLNQVEFNPPQDQLWFAGDLVNRGPSSLAVLRFAHDLGKAAQVVLGNHDLHLLAIAAGQRSPSHKDTLEDILNAADSEELLFWLRHQRLMIYDIKLGYSMVHAGIPPAWSIETALTRAKEVETVLQSADYRDFFNHMYGNSPSHYSEDLLGWPRLRVITNYFTRMRFIDPQGQLELETKTEVSSAPEGFAPWFAYPDHACRNEKILFGHWAAINGVTNSPYAIALDTGCVWGGSLTMMRLEDGRQFTQPCQGH